MPRESRMLAGILLIVLPTVMYGGVSLLSLLTSSAPGYNDNPVRHDLWRAGPVNGLVRCSAEDARTRAIKRHGEPTSVT